MVIHVGHVAALAKKQKAGVDSVPGCEGILMQASLGFQRTLLTFPQELTEPFAVF
jgi:hypothetical protein